MKDEICWFLKFGYCKYKESCKRKHYGQECEELGECSNIKSCEKRHPKRCRKFASGNTCKLKNYCTYSHKKSVESQEINLLRTQVNFLEKTLSGMNVKMMCLEDEMKQMMYNKATKEPTTEKVESSKKTEDSIKVKGISARVQDQKKDSNEKEDPKD